MVDELILEQPDFSTEIFGLKKKLIDAIKFFVRILLIDLINNK